MAVGTLAIIGIAQSSTIYTYKLANTKPTAERPVKYVYSIDYLKGIAGEASIQYGLSGQDYQEMIDTIQCESGWQIYPKPNYISWGIAEFMPATWHDFGNGDIMDPIMQIKVMARMWSKGLMGRWDCAKILGFIK